MNQMNYDIYKLRKWIYYIDYELLSRNTNAIHLLKDNLDKVEWYFLSSNPNAITLLEQNQENINWAFTSRLKVYNIL